MSVNLTNAQKEVIRKIIYAVETGGQVYGGVRYDDFTEAYTNSSSEHAITIGGGAWYATEAQRLLKLIRTTDSALFKKLDTAGIGSDLDSKDWSTYKLSKGSAKAKCIQKIIGSNVGIKCQDSLIDSQMQKYIDEAATLGVTNVAAQMMCANFRHQGGLSAMKRVVAKTRKPYTLDNLYAACQTDTGNQVGAYKSRQKMVYNSLKKYLPTSSTSNTTGGKTMTENELRQKVVETAKKYLGCNEADGSHRKIIDGYNAHKPLARSYKVTYTDAWCATFVSFISIQCGLTDIMPTECGCGAMIELYRKLGRWEENDAYVPKVGDIIMYYWNDNGAGDCTGYPDHVGIVVSVSGNTITVIEGNRNNRVAYREIAVNGRYIRGFCLPKYSSKATSSSSSGNTSTPATPSAPSNNTQTSGTLSKTVQWYGITTDELNVRTWVGTKNKTCSFSPLKKGTRIGVCASQKASDGSVWYYIKYNGKYGFVHSGYVKKESTSNSSNASSSNKLSYAESKKSAYAGTYKTTDALNLRTGAGTSFKVITTIPCGGTVHCYGYYTAVNGTNWYLVQYGTITGFVSSKYLKRA